MNLEPETILLQRNIRPTAMRVLVCRFLMKQVSAVSLTDLESAFEKVERTTLYRNLKTFQKKGMVHKIDDGSGVAKYALCETDCTCDLENDLHLHFYCSECGGTFCLPDHKLPKLNLPKNYIAENANLVVKGKCAKC